MADYRDLSEIEFTDQVKALMQETEISFLEAVEVLKLKELREIKRLLSGISSDIEHSLDRIRESLE